MLTWIDHVRSLHTGSAERARLPPKPDPPPSTALCRWPEADPSPAMCVLGNFSYPDEGLERRSL